MNAILVMACTGVMLTINTPCIMFLGLTCLHHSHSLHLAQFKGLVGLILFDRADVDYSFVTVGTSIPQHSGVPNDFATRWLQVRMMCVCMCVYVICVCGVYFVDVCSVCVCCVCCECIWCVYLVCLVVCTV